MESIEYMETLVSHQNAYSNGYQSLIESGSANKKNIKEIISEMEKADKGLKPFVKSMPLHNNSSVDSSACLYTIQQIACLEDLLGAVTIEFSKMGCELSNKEQESILSSPQAVGAEGMAARAQNCILSVDSYWNWISTLGKCSNIHLENTANYHKFFHEVKELKNWMPATLLAAQNIIVLEEHNFNDIEMTKEFSQDLKELSSLFIHWTTKITSLWEFSKKVYPIGDRLKSCDFQKPIVALCDYKTQEITVRANEELLLVDSSNPHLWKVRSLTSQECSVPSIIFLLPGPCSEAIAYAQKARLEFLTMWTIQIKRIGKNLILFLIIVLSDVTENDIKYLSANELDKKNEMFTLLDDICEGFSPLWDGYSGYNEFSSKVNLFKTSISPIGDKDDADMVRTDVFMEKLANVSNLLSLYQMFWKQWDTYRIIVQSSKEPDSILIVNKVHKLKYVNRDYLKKIWQSEMSFDGQDDNEFLEWMTLLEEHWNNDYQMEEEIEVVTNEVVNMTPPRTPTPEVVEELPPRTPTPEVVELPPRTPTPEVVEVLQEEIKVEEVEATPEEIVLEEEEEEWVEEEWEEEFFFEETVDSHETSRTFVISGVFHPVTNEEISLQDAIAEGIINNDAGAYVNKVTGDLIPIPEAINRGLIKMTF